MMPSLTTGGSCASACGSRVAMEFPACSRLAPAPVKTSLRESASRVVNMAPNTATPKAEPTSRK